MSLELTREGPIWRMMDFTSDLFGSSLSTVFAMSLADLEMLRPIEETLAMPDASDILEKSFRMVLEKGIMKSSTKNPVVFTKKTCNLETADGLSYEIGDQAMVELLGQKRVVNGQVQVLARPFVYTQRDANGQLIYYNKLEGWMPEEALPSTGEEDVWGTEQSSEPETQEEP
jgi:hypothetical protein